MKKYLKQSFVRTLMILVLVSTTLSLSGCLQLACSLAQQDNDLLKSLCS